MPDRIVTVLGATGYTGGLIAAELRRRGTRFAIAGRNPGKLAALSERLGGVDSLPVEVGNAASLAGLAQRSRVIINCAGPFVDLGEPVVVAAIAHGSHYLDTTGEQPFIKAMREKHAGAAADRGVAVVPAMAFEIALSDCAAALGADGYSSVETVQVTYAVTMRASQGTQRTALRMLGGSGWAYRGGEWVEERPAEHRARVDLPPPYGHIAAVSFPSAEVITIPWHVRAREVRAFMRVPKAAAGALAGLVPLLPAVGRLAARFGGALIGEGTGGPDEAARAASDFCIAVDVRGVRQGRARWRRVLLSGRDPYGLTAIIAVEGAERLCRPGFDRAGVLAPAQVVEGRDFLAAIRGVKFEVEERAD